MADEPDFANLKPTNVVCPECNSGTLIPKRGRFGPLYKCSTRGCKFYVETRPTGDNCNYLRDEQPCGALIVKGTKTIPNRCSDKQCPNRNPHKLNN